VVVRQFCALGFESTRGALLPSPSTGEGRGWGSVLRQAMCPAAFRITARCSAPFPLHGGRAGHSAAPAADRRTPARVARAARKGYGWGPEGPTPWARWSKVAALFLRFAEIRSTRKPSTPTPALPRPGGGSKSASSTPRKSDRSASLPPPPQPSPVEGEGVKSRVHRKPQPCSVKTHPTDICRRRRSCRPRFRSAHLRWPRYRARCARSGGAPAWRIHRRCWPPARH
jgi:hypothetical protein